MISLFITFILLLSSVADYLRPGSPGSQKTGIHPVDSHSRFEDIYLSLHEPSLKREAFYLAMQGHLLLKTSCRLENDSLITIIDYSLPSSQDRFFVINLRRSWLVYKTLVSHGRNSGELYATSFSNRMHSYQTSLGFYLTGIPYQGGKGYSLLLEGLDKGFNDQARKRAIVIHGAGYATRDYINRYGRLGRSLGCPVLPPELNCEIINAIKGGSVVFCYYPDPSYLTRSVLLHSADGKDI
jgi:hypothetical protein